MVSFVNDKVTQAVICDCDTDRAEQVASLLQQLGYQSKLVDLAEPVDSWLESVRSSQMLVIGDVGNAQSKWVELVSRLRDSLGEMQVIACGSADTVEALSAAGATRLVRLSLPCSVERLAQLLNRPLPHAEQDNGSVTLLTGVSPAVREVNQLIKQVASHGSSVLILGESGTGKEMVARAVHDASPRRQRPFVAINCGAIPSELLESELFGHEKGAFTGAVAARKGRFEIAEGGTLFLDEIGDMSMIMQVKLLRVLQERVFERVGSHTPIRCNVRIIAATHRNLETSIANGNFREDLFYRLNVFPIEMPPLRQRTEDLPWLINDFIKLNAANGRARLQIPTRVTEALSGYSWPGNVRELSNLMERLSILCPDGRVDIGHLPARYRPADWQPESMPEDAISDEMSVTTLPDVPMQPLEMQDADEGVLPDEYAMLHMSEPVPSQAAHELPPQGLDLRTHLFEIERALIRQALDRADGTVAKAARLLRLRRTTLVEKLRKFDLLEDRVATDF